MKCLREQKLPYPGLAGALSNFLFTKVHFQTDSAMSKKPLFKNPSSLSHDMLVIHLPAPQRYVWVAKSGLYSTFERWVRLWKFLKFIAKCGVGSGNLTHLVLKWPNGHWVTHSQQRNIWSKSSSKYTFFIRTSKIQLRLKSS